MAIVKVGDVVRLTEKHKNVLIANGCWAHVEEFGNCIGVVIGEMFPGLNCPEVDVRWKPSNLKYGYDVDNLEVINDSHK